MTGAVFNHESMIRKNIEHSGWTESHMTIPGPMDRERLGLALDKLSERASVVAADIFGTREEIAAMERCLGESGVVVPPTRVVSTASGEGGVQLVAASGGDVAPLMLDGGVVGALVEAGGAARLYLGGVTPPDASAARGEQTEAVFGRIECALGVAGMTFADVARTWFYNDQILDWYAEFNAVRTGFFRRHDVRQMPASTGIGAPNPTGAALVGKALAIALRQPGAALVEQARSPLQGEAFAYGSAFSRAVVVRDACSRTLHVSGTASIDPAGNTAHRGDTCAQIALTMRVVSALVEEAAMGLGDTVRAVVYVRDAKDIPLWHTYCRERGLGALPAVVVGADICRDDLLFEIELELAVPRG